MTEDHSRPEAEIEKLRKSQQDLYELVEAAFRRIAYDREGLCGVGWHAALNNTLAANLGDCLVERGTWERHPAATGRLQRYRPVTAAGPVEIPGGMT